MRVRGRSLEESKKLIKEAKSAVETILSGTGRIRVRSVRCDGIKISNEVVKKVKDGIEAGQEFKYYDKMLAKAIKVQGKVNFKNPEYYIVPASIVVVPSRSGL